MNKVPRQSQQCRWWWLFKSTTVLPRLGGSTVAVIRVDSVDELMSVALSGGWWWDGWGRICVGFFLSYLI